MSDNGEGATGTADQAFFERLRRALAHDLRTPLGTIANYAAILEYHGQAKPADVHVFAGRIRQSAVRIALMLQHMTDGMRIARSKPSTALVDPDGIVRALLSEMPYAIHYPSRAEPPRERVPIGGELLKFTWRAFLAIHAEAAGEGPLDLDVEVVSSDDDVAVDLWMGPRPEAALAHAGSKTYLEAVPDASQHEACFALGLAEDLIRSRGGELSLWGSPGQASRLRIRFPIAR